jgi:Icc-related predicted phosphoesterase
MIKCFFVTDLHGKLNRYQKLFKQIQKEKPAAVFLGGDLLPSGLFALAKNAKPVKNFLNDFLIPEFLLLKTKLGQYYPRVFLIMGNDDGRTEEQEFIKAEAKGIWEYIHNKKVGFREYTIYGYAYVPPTPFLLKDWERYDVSRYVNPGCISPEEGWRSIQVQENHVKYSTIQKDLVKLTGENDLSKSIFLFHTPPYQTALDRAALDGKMIDHVPLDVHLGSVAVKKLIEKRQPLITLHGHIHESATITGSWKQKIGTTHAFSAAHNGPELSLVRFDPKKPQESTRELI